MYNIPNKAFTFILIVTSFVLAFHRKNQFQYVCVTYPFKLLSHILCFHQVFKFRFGSHFGLDIETKYFVFRIVSVYHFGGNQIYIYIYRESIYIT